MRGTDVYGIVGTVQAGNFQIEAAIAEGAYSVIYKAYHDAFRAKVALKCLKVPSSFSASQRTSFLERFRAEGETLFHLSAALPEVTRPLHVDLLTPGGGQFVPFIALEWLEGETLAAIIQRRRATGRRPLALGKIVHLLAPAARAVEHAHAFVGPKGPRQIVHGELHTDNLFVVRDGTQERLKILDFGMVRPPRRVDRDAEEEPGAPWHAAPEQWRPKRYGQLGPATDVWGLALSIVEAVTGVRPIDGDAAEQLRICTDEAQRPTPRQLRVEVSDAVEAVFQKALAVHPRSRFTSVMAFWDALEQALGEEDLEASAPAAARGRPRLESVVEEQELAAAPTVVARAPEPRVAPPPRAARASASAETVVAVEEDLEADLEPPPVARRPRPPQPSRPERVVPDDAGTEMDLAQAPTERARPRQVDDAGLGGGEIALAVKPRRRGQTLLGEDVPVSGGRFHVPVKPLEVDLGPPVAQPAYLREGAKAPPGRASDAHGEISIHAGAPSFGVRGPKPSEEAPKRTTSPMFMPSLVIILGTVATGIDIAFTSLLGEPMVIGSIRVAMVAAPIILVGIGLWFWRVFEQRG